MDIQTAFIGAATFIVSAGILAFIAMFGMKEKSYEEALAEQRQQTNSLLGSQTRPKPKEKKAKKANKKVKEKQVVVVPETEIAEESEDTESPSTSSTSSAPQTAQKPHVEFKETAGVSEEATNVTNKKKRKKKDKVRPSLIHKDVENSVDVGIVEVTSANHFELLHPKDEFELLQSHLHIKEELNKDTKEKSGKVKQNNPHQEVPKEKGNKTRPSTVENKDKSEQIKEKKSEQVKEKNVKKEEKIVKKEEKIVKKEEKIVKKEEKNVKKEEKQNTVVDALQKPSKPSKTVVHEKQETPVEVPHTNGIVKEKKKKKNEINTLHQITGSKDGEINLVHLLNMVRNAELSRSEVQILIDLLLNKQHEAPVTLDEWSEGKADPVQKLKKQLAEKEKALAEEQEALVGAQAKLREIRNEQVAEKSQLQQRTRGLEEALQAKHLELQSINNRWHNQNQKMQQMQAQLNEESLTIRKLSEENGALQLQRKQLDMHLVQSQEAEATIQELQSRNNQLTLELHSLTEQLAGKEHQQNVMVQLQHQVNHYKSEIDEKENFIRQFEDIRRDLEHRLGVAHRQENELNSVCQQHVEEIRRVEHGKNQAFEEIKNLQKQKDDLQHNLTLLKRELLDAQTEQSLKANGLAEEDQNHKEELLNLHNELSSVESELQHLKANYTVELEASKNSYTLLETELNEQKNKNNDLRKKNWKVIDALKAAESKSVQDSVKNVPKNTDDILSQTRVAAQKSNKEFVERLFPEIKISESAPYEQWMLDMGSAIEKYVSDLENSKSNDSQVESTKLQAQVQHYKTIIDDTEGILKKLQNHIEQEEIHWRRELQAKELEIEGLKQHYLSELNKKVTELQLQLNAEQEEKQKLSEQLKSRPADDKEGNLSNDNSQQVETNDVCLKEQISASTNGSSVTVDT